MCKRTLIVTNLLSSAAVMLALLSFYESKFLVLKDSYAARYEEIESRQESQEFQIKYYNKLQKNEYSSCLKREHKLGMQLLITRKRDRKYYLKVLKLNKQRVKAWLKKEKPLHRQAYSQTYKK